MKKTLAKIGSIGAVALLCAAPLAAQNNNSDANPGGNAAVTGIYVPIPGGVPRSAISNFSATLSSGALVSPINGAPIPAAVGNAILALMNGSSGGLSTVQDALNAAGAPTGPTADLMKAMSKISNGNRTISRGELKNIAKQFNAMINASTGAFLSSNNPMLLGLQATVSSLINAAGLSRP